MAVRVIIDRKVKKGKESEFSELLKQLRSKAVSSKGYISGETLRALSDRYNYIVVSTWQSLDDWRIWEKNLVIKRPDFYYVIHKEPKMGMKVINNLAQVIASRLKGQEELS